jgi:hypothetical protein
MEQMRGHRRKKQSAENNQLCQAKFSICAT